MNLKKEFLCFSNHLWIDSICLGYLSLSRSIAIWSCLNNCDWRKMFKLVGILIFEDPPTHLSQPYNRPQLKLSESTCMSFQPTFHSCSSHIPIQTGGESGTAVHIWHRAECNTVHYRVQTAVQIMHWEILWTGLVWLPWHGLTHSAIDSQRLFPGSDQICKLCLHLNYIWIIFFNLIYLTDFCDTFTLNIQTSRTVGYRFSNTILKISG